MMRQSILKLDVAGRPIDWIGWEAAATLYARDRVRWEAGETSFTLQGGFRDDGLRSTMTLSSIIAVADQARRWEQRWVPPLTNRALFARDGHLCLYCGGKFSARDLTRDHVHPVSRGGRNVWENCASSCRRCNHAKGDLDVSEFRPLLGVPFVPDPARYLLLVASGRITADQQAFLERMASKSQSRH